MKSSLWIEVMIKFLRQVLLGDGRKAASKPHSTRQSTLATEVAALPHAHDKNTQTCVVGAKLAYDPLDVPMVDLKRLAKPPIAARSAPPILCQFAIRNERNAFYSKYLSLRNLNLEHIGFNNKNRIFINENQTPKIAKSILLLSS
ncbi:conserved hypothetical protein [Culex quinquefasciatus]|uniref:Uncharacterized protein n=1 Tax=Culex quinquefasciatus TaxID=7176 RepID=B0X725_CULQU|nr:conserved hypothetical protein [Culex quinquefasciatus]|eukprot:XP_001865447.1 conserved hypothetical protein [Culex quinquefasciatus]